MHAAESVAGVAAVALCIACDVSRDRAPPPTPADGNASRSGAAPLAPPIAVEAGFLDVPPRRVTLGGRPVSIAATARLFYNLQPADNDPDQKPILFINNGFTAEIVRAYGTGPSTVVEGGAVVANPSRWTRFANVVYLEPRQAGYSYDVLPNRVADASDCSPDVFNEYVDAGDTLYAALAFLEHHTTMRGPVYWAGESYAGVRVTWILSYLRGRWDLARYDDPVLAAKIADAISRRGGTSLFAGQVLLEAWLAGGAHTRAIADECTDPAQIAAVEVSVGAPCSIADACICAAANDRSLYDFAYSGRQQAAREMEASAAHVDPARASMLLGLPLGSIPALLPAGRAGGFRCSAPDATVPPDDLLGQALGTLPAGQWYYVPYSPLMPGKETMATTPDWRAQPFEGEAFLDNVHDVPAFATDGPLDLVVPMRALAPALRVVAGAARIDASGANALGVLYSDGERFITIARYPMAGHMVTMLAPAALSADLGSWLAAR